MQGVSSSEVWLVNSVIPYSLYYICKIRSYSSRLYSILFIFLPNQRMSLPSFQGQALEPEKKLWQSQKISNS